MRDELNQIMDDTIREIMEVSHYWGEDTPENWRSGTDEIRKILERFLRNYIREVFNV